MNRDDLEKAAAEAVSAANYYDLMDNMGSTTDEELQKIIEANGDEEKEERIPVNQNVLGALKCITALAIQYRQDHPNAGRTEIAQHIAGSRSGPLYNAIALLMNEIEFKPREEKKQ